MLLKRRSSSRNSRPPILQPQIYPSGSTSHPFPHARINGFQSGSRFALIDAKLRSDTGKKPSPATIFTAVSHFAPMRKGLIAMVPPGLPRPDLFVDATGVL